MSAVAPSRIAVIGGGPNGVIAVNELISQLPGIAIDLYGRGDRWGHGLVYGEQELASSRQSFITAEMGVDPHDDAALANWVEESRDDLRTDFANEDLTAYSYPPRKLVGRYFADRIDVAVRRAEQTNTKLQLIADPVVEARSLSPERSGGPFELICSSGRKASADYIFLCLGNFPSSFGRHLQGNPGYHSEIWGIDFFDQIPVEDDILIVGSGLSSIDVLFGLNSHNHYGRVLFASRNGLLPTVQANAAASNFAEMLSGLLSAKPALPDFEASLASLARQAGIECFWDLRPGCLNIEKTETLQQEVVRLLGPHMPVLWNGWSMAERRHFDKGRNAAWNALHLPMARHSAEMLACEIDRGRLTVGKLEDLRRMQSGFMSRVSGVERHVDRVINATGRNLDVATITDPLVSSLLKSELLSPHPLGGFDVDFNTSRRGDIFVTGPLTRGVRFYTYVLSENARQTNGAVSALARQMTGEAHVDVAFVSSL